MRLVKPIARTPTASPPGGRRTPTHYPPRIPPWLQKRIEDKGEYVLLWCGHKDNLNDRSVLLIAGFGGNHKVRVYCERCDEWTTVRRNVRFREYLGIPAANYPDVPMF